MRRAGHRLRRLQPAGPRLPDRAVQDVDDLPPDDYRRNAPRFQGENFQKNLDLVKQDRGAGRGARAARRASSPWRGCWPRATTSCRSPARSGPSTSTKTSARLDVALTPEELAQIDAILPPGAASGERYPQAMRGDRSLTPYFTNLVCRIICIMLNSVNAARPNTPSLASLPRCPAHPTRLASVGGASRCVRGPTSGSLPPGASQVFENPMMSGPIRRNFARWIDATDRGHARLLTSAGAEPCGGSQECARARSALVRRSKDPG